MSISDRRVLRVADWRLPFWFFRLHARPDSRPPRPAASLSDPAVHVAADSRLPGRHLVARSGRRIGARADRAVFDVYRVVRDDDTVRRYRVHRDARGRFAPRKNAGREPSSDRRARLCDRARGFEPALLLHDRSWLRTRRATSSVALLNRPAQPVDADLNDGAWPRGFSAGDHAALSR